MDLYSSKSWKLDSRRSIGKKNLFENRIFESKFLKLESKIISAKSIDRLSPIIAIVKYTEGFEDERISVNAGIVKPLIQFIPQNHSVPYRIEIENSNKSPILVSLFTFWDEDTEPVTVNANAFGANSANNMRITHNNFGNNKPNDDVNIIIAPNQDGSYQVQSGGS